MTGRLVLSANDICILSTSLYSHEERASSSCGPGLLNPLRALTFLSNGEPPDHFCCVRQLGWCFATDRGVPAGERVRSPELVR